MNDIKLADNPIIKCVDFSYLQDHIQRPNSVVGILTDGIESHKRILSDTKEMMISWGGVYDRNWERYVFPSGAGIYFKYEYENKLAKFLKTARFTHLRFDPYSKFSGDVFHMARISERSK